QCEPCAVVRENQGSLTRQLTSVRCFITQKQTSHTEHTNRDSRVRVQTVKRWEVMRQLSAWQQHPSTVKVRRFTSSRRSARCQAGRNRAQPFNTKSCYPCHASGRDSLQAPTWHGKPFTRAGGPGGLPDRLLTSLTDAVNRVRDIPASLSLSAAPGQSRAFGFLAASSSALAVLALTIPDQLLEGVLPAPDYFGRFELLDSIYLRVAGATLIPSAAVEYCLMDAAANDRLGSATYQRLMLGCAAKSAGFLAAFVQVSTARA
ncbi:hypothetical protein QJQ45_022643, partial [Haematococcus lacustris]